MIKTNKLNILLNIGLVTLSLLITIFFIEIFFRYFYNMNSNYGDDAWVNKVLTDDYYFKGNSWDIDNVPAYIDKDNGLIYQWEDNTILPGVYAGFDHVNVSKNKPIDNFRIVVIGDSFTGGAGLEDTKNVYHQHLKKLIKEDTITKKEVEILPIFQAGINTYQEMILARDYAMGYDPDILILQYCDNDIEGERLELGTQGENQFYISTKTNLLPIGNLLIPAFPHISESLSYRLLNTSAFMQFLSFKINRITTKKQVNIEKSLEAIKEINKFTREENIPFIVINFPPASEEFKYCSDSSNTLGGIQLHKRIEELSNSSDFEFINLCEHIDDMKSIASETERPNSFHYNNDGHQIAAEVLHKALTNMNLNIVVAGTSTELNKY